MHHILVTIHIVECFPKVRFLFTAMDIETDTNAFQKQRCEDIICPERAECCTTVRWRISERDFHDGMFREWWLLHEGARIYEEGGAYFIHWPMRCRNVSDDGLRCMDYANRPATCRLYTCRRMAENRGSGHE
jgi:Fe-S-cluster containining protein